MDWDQIRGDWEQYEGRIKKRWGKLTENDLTVAAGEKDDLVEKIQERYGIEKEDAERQVEEFCDACG